MFQSIRAMEQLAQTWFDYTHHIVLKMNNDTKFLNISRYNTILDLKQEVQKIKGISIDQQKIHIVSVVCDENSSNITRVDKITYDTDNIRDLMKKNNSSCFQVVWDE
ncbi:MAG TPA: hypothetical protein VGW78_05450 [Candidatus Babeliales bacterium]|jgi:hypothetical protein|nr:hypothetical protein [Candidatus Babeliales bacterium]